MLKCLVDLRGECLSFDADVADRWGRLLAHAKKHGTTPSTVDSMIAATALHHNLTLVTRNEKDVTLCGVTPLKPWT